ncbi:MAG: hypothetical protein H6Q20_2381 [Bacteroidetes bacterium]|jgi:hypothetical protein|nr:hypothetical protein [Bacteroidota bacterium]
MKRIFAIVVVFVAIAANSYALDLNEYRVFYKLTNEKTFDSLNRYLNTTSEQEDQLKYIFSLTEKKMKNAVTSENEKEAEKTMWFNLGNVKYVLSNDQYKKYLVAINLSVNSNNNEFFAENK